MAFITNIRGGLRLPFQRRWLRRYTFGCTSRTYIKLCLLVMVFFYLDVRISNNSLSLNARPCRVRKLDPWDKMMQKYIQQHKPIQCPDKSTVMYMDELDVLQLNNSAVAEYSLQSMNCEYRRIKTEDYKLIDFDDPVKFTPPIFIPHRVFQVRCYLHSKVVYQYMFTNLIWNQSAEREKEIEYETDDKPSVIYLGFDSLSRSEAVRKLALSYPYFVDKLGGYDLQGFMKIGLNTYPNMVALHRGIFSKEFFMKGVLGSDLDGERFLWSDASENGYATLYMEDNVFTKFKRSPVDYFWKTYDQAKYTTDAVIIDNLGPASSNCYGNKKQFHDQIDYIKRFVTKYKNRRKFVFLWHNQLTHGEQRIELGDKDLFEFIVWLKRGGHLDKAVLVIGSDHGFRIGGGASRTYVGKLEMNMPLQMIALPSGLKIKYPWIHKQFMYNTHMLTTHYDMFETLKGFINSDYIEKENIFYTKSRLGRKLYTRISSERTCDEAGVPPNHCTCEDGAQPIETSTPLIHTLANRATDKINDILGNQKHLCKKLELLNLTEARVTYKARGNDVIYGPRDLYNWLFIDDASGRYTIGFYTKPNQGMFQAILDVDSAFAKDEKYVVTVIDDPVRMDKYGNQSHCLTDSFLKQYCLCMDVHVG